MVGTVGPIKGEGHAAVHMYLPVSCSVSRGGSETIPPFPRLPAARELQTLFSVLLPTHPPAMNLMGHKFNSISQKRHQRGVKQRLYCFSGKSKNSSKALSQTWEVVEAESSLSSVTCIEKYCIGRNGALLCLSWRGALQST